MRVTRQCLALEGVYVIDWQCCGESGYIVLVYRYWGGKKDGFMLFHTFGGWLCIV